MITNAHTNASKNRHFARAAASRNANVDRGSKYGSSIASCCTIGVGP
ncbi:hypothetical protein EUX98_g2288 [Antrodiella citrinella]|uniref:Uncharacterized protein n=1 Tax=Antrodiella citrinella TaxID=2447956 RepID=A0A4S4MZE5_9APHY|nr:hypothetical protein EUX98_g2288 [Antrodiella citrinella]